MESWTEGPEWGRGGGEWGGAGGGECISCKKDRIPENATQYTWAELCN